MRGLVASLGTCPRRAIAETDDQDTHVLTPNSAYVYQIQEGETGPLAPFAVKSGRWQRTRLRVNYAGACCHGYNSDHAPCQYYFESVFLYLSRKTASRTDTEK